MKSHIDLKLPKLPNGQPLAQSLPFVPHWSDYTASFFGHGPRESQRVVPFGLPVRLLLKLLVATSTRR
jgi:hypothetical protein